VKDKTITKPMSLTKTVWPWECCQRWVTSS